MKKQCQFCGETYFSGKVLAAIEEEFKKIYYEGKKIKGKVPVEQFLELQVV